MRVLAMNVGEALGLVFVGYGTAFTTAGLLLETTYLMFVGAVCYIIALFLLGREKKEEIEQLSE